VINRRDSRLGHHRCYVLSSVKEDKKERADEMPWFHQRAGL